MRRICTTCSMWKICEEYAQHTRGWRVIYLKNMHIICKDDAYKYDCIRFLVKSVMNNNHAGKILYLYLDFKPGFKLSFANLPNTSLKLNLAKSSQYKFAKKLIQRPLAWHCLVTVYFVSVCLANETWIWLNIFILN